MSIFDFSLTPTAASNTGGRITLNRCSIWSRDFTNLISDWYRRVEAERFDAFYTLGSNPHGVGSPYLGQWSVFMYHIEYVWLRADIYECHHLYVRSSEGQGTTSGMGGSQNFICLLSDNKGNYPRASLPLNHHFHSSSSVFELTWALCDIQFVTSHVVDTWADDSVWLFHERIKFRGLGKGFLVSIYIYLGWPYNYIPTRLLHDFIVTGAWVIARECVNSEIQVLYVKPSDTSGKILSNPDWDFIFLQSAH